jgi:hypothetical protein
MRPAGDVGYRVSCEARVAANHPLRAIREIVNRALSALSADFEALYARLGARRSRQRSCCGRCCLGEQQPDISTPRVKRKL